MFMYIFVLYIVLVVFFIKQKTAYEMRISDWSSDVCSSDLFLGGISATLPWLGFHDRDYRQVVKGLPAEIVSRLQHADGASSYEYDPKCGSFVSVDSHLWKCLAMELVQEAGVKVLFHSQVVETMSDGNRILGVVVETQSGRQELFADITIDCSGEGDVAARAGGIGRASGGERGGQSGWVWVGA